MRFLAFALIFGAALVAAVWWGVPFLGERASQSTYVPDRTLHRVTIANDELRVPSNIIRFAPQRRRRSLDRLDLALHWPTGRGYTESLAAAFDRESEPLLYITVTPREMTAGMTDRLAAIYAQLFDGPPLDGPAGLILQPLEMDRGYDGEALVISADDTEPYVARCPMNADRTALSESGTCLHDFQAGRGLSVTYRFPVKWLGEWRAVDALVRNRMAAMGAG